VTSTDAGPNTTLETRRSGCHGGVVGYRFFSVPVHVLQGTDSLEGTKEMLEPESSDVRVSVERALHGCEFRDVRARDRIRALTSGDATPPYPTPGRGCGRSAIFATPPHDLPALLRLADELDRMTKQEAGERALVWRCSQCSTRYAVPVALARNVAIRCERCGDSVELHANRSLGEESLLDPFEGEVNRARTHLAGFFREAMARGWPVLVCSTD
jgi:DNA-directed RNA polymerase subunit RPC12/RpoP